MSRIDKAFDQSTPHAHDAAFKAAFQKKDLAKIFFQRYLPSRIVKMIDFRYLNLNNRSYVDEKLKQRHSDIVYRTKIKGKTAFLYILFEHQSKPDYWIVFRLLCYMTNLWREWIAQNPEWKRLPAILPAVLYHGKEPWTAPRSLSGIIGGEERLKRYLPEFTYDLYNLGDYPDESLLLGDAMALGVVLYLMKHIFDDNYGEHFIQAAEYLAQIDDHHVQLEFLEWMLRYTYHARDDDRGYIDRGLEKIGNEDARRVAMTIAERIRREGMVKGQIMLIEKQLSKRFGGISPLLEKRLRDSNLDLLDKFGESIFDFQNLQDAEDWWKKYPDRGNA